MIMKQYKIIYIILTITILLGCQKQITQKNVELGLYQTNTKEGILRINLSDEHKAHYFHDTNQDKGWWDIYNNEIRLIGTIEVNKELFYFFDPSIGTGYIKNNNEFHIHSLRENRYYDRYGKFHWHRDTTYLSFKRLI